ncbi:hypothetical protein BDM02DRAFT_3184361 [Thelephora ganbajun]|uniref:Uncharacterized protein n=1 Tax=Thelephora ganbajun TaxID=370292 RepID=A0ACB6ZQ15_THEGA|nr:hypothetical protein BDM02DRAFT_3184361 [Thelephora ganbajun]
MSRSRMSFEALKIHRSLRSTRNKSTFTGTQQSRVKPPGPNSPTGYKSGLTKSSRILQWTLVPGVFGYMALYGDFGEHEHIFSPLRRWVRKSKDEFWHLSPEEERIIQSETLRDPADAYEDGAGSRK